MFEGGDILIRQQYRKCLTAVSRKNAGEGVELVRSAQMIVVLAAGDLVHSCPFVRMHSIHLKLTRGQAGRSHA